VFLVHAVFKKPNTYHDWAEMPIYRAFEAWYLFAKEVTNR
jgi:hypothetical protein